MSTIPYSIYYIHVVMGYPHTSGILHPGDIVHTINGWTTRGYDIDTVADHMVCVTTCI